jgi:tRNA pseudouridine55 synthase
MNIPSGLLAVYKPKGITSSGVVERFVRILSDPKLSHKNQRLLLKVGHGGTLDPSAEGVLVLGIQNGTKLLQSYLKGNKKYYGIGLLGVATDTLDADGNVVQQMEYQHITHTQLEKIIPHLIGDILQVPPMYSALKKNGVPLYRLARKQGITIDREPRKIRIDSLTLDKDQKLPYFGIHVECGGGCYVRSLIDEIGKECSSCAHLVSLVRNQQGPFVIKDCLQEKQWNREEIIRGIRRCNRIAGIPENIGDPIGTQEEDHK